MAITGEQQVPIRQPSPSQVEHLIQKAQQYHKFVRSPQSDKKEFVMPGQHQILDIRIASPANSPPLGVTETNHFYQVEALKMNETGSLKIMDPDNLDDDKPAPVQQSPQEKGELTYEISKKTVGLKSSSKGDKTGRSRCSTKDGLQTHQQKLSQLHLEIEPEVPMSSQSNNNRSDSNRPVIT